MSGSRPANGSEIRELPTFFYANDRARKLHANQISAISIPFI